MKQSRGARKHANACNVRNEIAGCCWRPVQRRTIVFYIHDPVYAVRTNIVLDEKLVKEAMKLANVRTKREAVDVALRRFVHSGKQKR